MQTPALSTSFVITASIFSIMNSSTDAILDIELLTFMTPVTEDWDGKPDSSFTDPDFQEYLPHTWANLQANKKDKGKRVCFDSVEILSHKTGHPGPCTASVVEEVVLPVIEALRSRSPGPSKTTASSNSQPITLTPSSSSSSIISSQVEPTNPSSSFPPSGQFRYSFPLKTRLLPSVF